MSAMPVAFQHDQRFKGVVPALVSKVEDDGKEARIKVTYPWFNDPKMESDWCRVTYGYAGGGYGWVWVPEQGDEVAVCFQHGDIKFPIIMGGLYNGVDKPPTYRTKDRDQKIFRTKAGHQILLDDTKNERKVEVKSVDGHILDLDDKNKTATIQTKSGHKAELNDKENKITITTSSGVSITMDGKGSITLSASQKITLEAPKVELGPAATQSLVLGELFMGLFNAHVHTTTLPTTPTTPPLTPMTPAMLSQVSKTT